MEAQNTMHVNLLPVECLADISPQCALQMKIPILRSTWITECHAIWKQGDDFDFREVPPIPTTRTKKLISVLGLEHFISSTSHIL